MGEVLTHNLNTDPSASTEQNGSPDGSLTYRDRLRRGLGRMTEGVMSFADMTAGISLARDDLRLTRSAMDTLDEPFDGLIGRQAQADHISMGLEADIILDFRRNAQRAGFTDTDAMPDDVRSEAAQLAADQRREDMLAELTTSHPEWSQEDLQSAVETRTGDAATLLGMSAEQRDAYLAAQLEYHELRSAVPEIQSELSELRAERSERLSKIGRTALSGLVGLAGRVRDLPNALSARAMVAGMSISENLRNAAPEKRRTVIGTAAGLAVAGLATYIAYRAGHMPNGNGANYALANSSSPLPPTGVGSGNLPSGVGAQLPGGVGEFTIPSGAGSGNVVPASVGVDVIPSGVGAESQLPNGVGTGLPESVGAGTPEVTPSGVGVDTQPLPTKVGSSNPNLPTGVGEPLPTSVGGETQLPGTVGAGGENLTSVQSSSELFGANSSVDAWPAKIRVSEWNGKTLDGSLTGISRQMLVRSGVSNPSADQINTLVQTLRPQAQPNGWLLKGQELDLRPATSALKNLLKS
jgi:hypothetical protein